MRGQCDRCDATTAHQQELNERLTQANARIEGLKASLKEQNEINYDLIHDRNEVLSKANARIKDCEERVENTNGLLRQMEAREQKLVAALESMINEAKDQLQLYVRAYKKEPYDTGIMLQLHINGTVERIEIASDALKAHRGEG